MTELRRNEVLSFLSDQQAAWTSYQNHKETSAWAGVAALAVVYASVVRLRLTDAAGTSLARGILTLLLLSLSTVVYKFVAQELELRRRGSALAAAATKLRIDLITDVTTSMDLSP